MASWLLTNNNLILLHYLSKKFVARLECFLAGIESLPFTLEAEFGCIPRVDELHLELSLEECKAGRMELATVFFLVADKASLFISPSLDWFNNLPALSLMIFCFSTCIKDSMFTRKRGKITLFYTEILMWSSPVCFGLFRFACKINEAKTKGEQSTRLA